MYATQPPHSFKPRLRAWLFPWFFFKDEFKGHLNFKGQPPLKVVTWCRVAKTYSKHVCISPSFFPQPKVWSSMSRSGDGKLLCMGAMFTNQRAVYININQQRTWCMKSLWSLIHWSQQKDSSGLSIWPKVSINNLVLQMEKVRQREIMCHAGMSSAYIELVEGVKCSTVQKGRY